MRGAQTEGESRILSKVSGFGKFLSPTHFAGLLTQPDPSVALRHLPTLWGVTLPEGAKSCVTYY